MKTKYGINVNGTFADATKQIAELQNKFENKTPKNRFEEGTKTAMLQRYKEALDVIFNYQEANKAENSQVYKYGGDLKKYNLGGEILKNLSTTENLAQVANFGNFLMNKNTLDKLDVNMKPNLIDNPRYNYEDRSDFLRTKNNNFTANTLDSIRRTSSQYNPALVGEALSANLAANNEIEDREGARRDSYLNNYNSLLASTNASNAGILNSFEDQNTQLRNDRLGLDVNNRNALVQGIIGNMQVADQKETDRLSSLLIALRQGDTETLTRLFKNNPDIAEKLGIDPSFYMEQPEIEKNKSIPFSLRLRRNNEGFRPKLAYNPLSIKRRLPNSN